MKLLLLFLVLIGTTFIDVTQARTIEKREVNEDQDINIGSYNSICTCQDGICNRCDDNGCNTVSNCNVKREASDIDYAGAAELVKMFKADTSMCKCLNHGYCLAKKPNQKEYTEVKGCGERERYTHCDSSGCREVSDGQCECDRNGNRCEECDDKGCKLVRKCKHNHLLTWATNCTECDKSGCLKVPVLPKAGHRDCPRQCHDDVDDIVLQNKCVCKKDNNGNEKCQMCGKYSCNPVPNCERFATCTLDHRIDSFRRCYGFKHGEKHCRKMYSASEYKKRDEEWEIAAKGFGDYRFFSCECPSNGGPCKMCDGGGSCKFEHEYKIITQKDGKPPRPVLKCHDYSHHYNVTAHLH